jgi:hypothetical protein
MTQGDDHNLFGFVPEVFLDGGEDDEPDAGDLRPCTDADLALGGRRP